MEKSETPRCWRRKSSSRSRRPLTSDVGAFSMARMASEKIVCGRLLGWPGREIVRDKGNGDAYWLPEIFGLGGVSGGGLSGGCGFNRLVNERSGPCVLSRISHDGERQGAEEREEIDGLTEAGQIPVTAMPVFSSLLKSIACKE